MDVLSQFKLLGQGVAVAELQKQLVSQGMTPLQAQQLAQKIITGQAPMPTNIVLPQPPTFLGMSPMMLVGIGLVVIFAASYFMREK